MTSDAQELLRRFLAYAGSKTASELEAEMRGALGPDVEGVSESTLKRVLTGRSQRPFATTMRSIRAFLRTRGVVGEGELDQLLREGGAPAHLGERSRVRRMIAALENPGAWVSYPSPPRLEDKVAIAVETAVRERWGAEEVEELKAYVADLIRVRDPANDASRAGPVSEESEAAREAPDRR